MKIKTDLNKLQKSDIYSVILFVLYKLNEIPEYSALSELAYVLDEENLYNLCEAFGGCTIKIPTPNELKTIIKALLLYQCVNVEKIEYDEAVDLVSKEGDEVPVKDIKEAYQKVCSVLTKYEFKRK